jgi:hypothetical protein
MYNFSNLKKILLNNIYINITINNYIKMDGFQNLKNTIHNVISQIFNKYALMGCHKFTFGTCNAQLIYCFIGVMVYINTLA